MSSLLFPVYNLNWENTQPKNMCDIVFEKAKGCGGTLTEQVFVQKQPPEGFFKKGVMRIFPKFTRKHLCWNLFFDEVKLCRSATSLKARLSRRCFLVNFCKICKNTYFAEHHWATVSDYSSIKSSEGRIGKRNYKN